MSGSALAIEHISTKQSPPERVLPQNAGKAWTAAEDARLKSEFEHQHDIGALPHLHLRTRGSISARLVRLGLIAVEEPAPQEPSLSHSTPQGSDEPGSKPKGSAA